MKEIPLTNSDKVALVDDEDYERVMQHNWCLTTNGYVMRTDDRSTLLHRFVMGYAPSGLEYDHIDRNRLNNSRSNLRLATHSQNQANTLKQSGKSSQYKGVSWNSFKGKWTAQIRKDYKKKDLGSFDNERDAAKAYDKAALELFGQFAKPNFPA